jgi:hypothetical protein
MSGLPGLNASIAAEARLQKFVASQKRDLWDISDQQKEFLSPGQGRDGGTGSRHGRAAMGGRR